MRFVDLTAPIEPSPADAPPLMRIEIEYLDHAAGAAEIESMFGVPLELLRNHEGWSRETITSLGTHNSTHVDAPWHYNSIVGGAPAAEDRRVAAGTVLRPRRGARLHRQVPTETRSTAEQMEGRSQPRPRARGGDIVLVHTGRDAFYGRRTT